MVGVTGQNRCTRRDKCNEVQDHDISISYKICSEKVSVAEPVQAIIRACAPSIHALRLVLRCHGQTTPRCRQHTPIIVARLTYATSQRLVGLYHI